MLHTILSHCPKLISFITVNVVDLHIKCLNQTNIESDRKAVWILLH